MTTTEDLYSEDGLAEIFPVRLAITAMRDSGYKNTAYALAELIDNAVQARASVVEVLCIEKRELVSQRERRRLDGLAVLDNGSGMNAQALRMALQFGNGTRLNDRTGIGRFGMGLPNASISQAQRVDVWSWMNGADNAIRTFIDLGEIETGKMRNVPEPEYSPVPNEWRERSHTLGKTGTLVVWSKLDLGRLTWKSARSTLRNTERIVGRVYRRFIMSGDVTIRLFATEEGQEDPIQDQPAVFDDPLYLTPSSLMPDPFDKKGMFEHVFDEEHAIEYNGSRHNVTVRYSIAIEDTVKVAGTRKRGDTAYGKLAADNMGISVMRAGREIMLDPAWCNPSEPRDRWWGAEIEFPPALDEVFGVTNNKQAATHFSELAATEWDKLAEEGETFIDVVNRLTEMGDVKGKLLSLSDSIKRNLNQLRRRLKAQGAGSGSTKKERHEADSVTKTVNDGWKERSKENPIEGEGSPTRVDLQEIRDDLTNNKLYSDTDAEELVSLILNADLRVVFLEADFPDAYQLFNVEMKGSITEITFNRQHPAFDDIFGTVTVDEDINELSNEEVLERLMRAVNATKITFAAWARYEREAGMARAKALQRVRFDWGQIAAKFLHPEEDLL